MLVARTVRLLRLGSPLVLAAISACVRPPLTDGCPEVQVGELVITEIRGAQGGAYRQWIELYNAGDHDIALGGLAVVFTRQNGKPDGRFVVRDEALTVAPGDYIVLGGDIVLAGGTPGSHPYIDYDYTVDYYTTRDVLPKGMPDGVPDDADLDGKIDKHSIDLPAGGFVDLVACGERVERVLLRSLPNPGTLYWPGEPDAAANDEGADWCRDTFTLGPNGTDIFGTPGEPNPPCPADTDTP